MDILKAEIERKKRLLQEKQMIGPNKKYFKRGDLNAKLTEDYMKINMPVISTNSSDQLKNSSVDPTSTKDVFSNTSQSILPRKEVIKRLRERNEPIILFGESEFDAYQRLKQVEMDEPTIHKGKRNDMKAAMDKVDEEYLKEILRANGESESSSNDVKVVDDGITIEDVHKQSDKLGTGNPAIDCEVILKFIKLIIKLWGDDLNSRNCEQKRTFKGKLASATHAQTVSYLKPLMKKLRKNELSSDLLTCMVDIVKLLLDRHYIKAYDAYLEMSIGNAPWPIGVTMVGIHARTGREKINDKNVAHVLNDETQRKYIQALKRLMTHCQRFFPTDPSRSVEFQGEVH